MKSSLVLRLFIPSYLLIVFLAFPFSKSLATCNNLFSDFKTTKEIFNGKKVEILESRDGSKIDISKLLGEENVFLGITRGGHFYLSVGKTIYDGSYIPNATTASHKAKDYNPSGYIIHFPNVGRKKIEEWLENFNDGFQGYSFSCVSAACSALKNSFGINVADRSLPLILSGSFFNTVLQKGFVDKKGNPVDYTIYRNSKNVPDLMTFNKELKSQDKLYGFGSSLFLAMSGGGLAYLLYLIH